MGHIPTALTDCYPLPCPLRALFGHADGNPNVITYVGSGTGGLEEMVESIDDAQFMYGLGKLACLVMLSPY